MTYTATTYAEARAIAARLLVLYRNTDWFVSIEGPLFKGDTYRVNVN